jgi:exopolysaccharide biosynthesis polyprenyl glycosylphosphotransferase
MNDTSIKVKKAILFFGDTIILYLGLIVTLYLRYWPNQNLGDWQQHLLPFSIIYAIWLVVFHITGLYELSSAKNNLFFYSALLKAVVVNAALAVLFFYLFPSFGISPKTNLALNLVIVTVLIYLWRQIFNRLVKSPALLNNVLIIGRGKEAEQLIRYIQNNPQLGYRVKKIITEKETRLVSNLVETVVKEKIQTIVTIADPRQDGVLIQNLYHCLPLKVNLFDLPKFYEQLMGEIPVSVIEEVWFLENLMSSPKNIYDAFKRGFDIVFAIILGAVALIFFPFIALAIKLDSPGPIFYRQKRVGKDNRIFEIIKFRSMIQDAEKNGAQWAAKTKRDPRVTRVGNALRKTRLDELPQLLNVLKGEMSFVGPRPERPEFVFGTTMQKEVPFYQVRHLVKPGLTGWAQINYEYGSSYADTVQKLQYDFYYLKNRSFLLDLSIILKTIKIVLSRKGV